MSRWRRFRLGTETRYRLPNIDKLHQHADLTDNEQYNQRQGISLSYTLPLFTLSIVKRCCLILLDVLQAFGSDNCASPLAVARRDLTLCPGCGGVVRRVSSRLLLHLLHRWSPCLGLFHFFWNRALVTQYISSQLLTVNVSCMIRKYKIPNYQNGHAYLTSHRVCYVAVDEPRKYSVGIDLKDIDRTEYQVRTGSIMQTGLKSNVS